MRRGIQQVVRVLFRRTQVGTLSQSPTHTGGRWMKSFILGLMLVALTGLGMGVYVRFFRDPPPPPEAPVFLDDHLRLPTSEEFAELARTDPVRMLDACLKRYQRETNGSFTATLIKKERVKGDPKPPKEPHEEVISLFVRGDVPDPTTNKPCIEVLMKWQSGARSFLGSEIRGTLYSEKPPPEGTSGKVTTWRPDARLAKTSSIPAADPLAQGQSRYCIRDAGLYRGMLRTYDAWKHRQEAGTLTTQYLGTTPIAALDGRLCHVVERSCPEPEVDAFEVGGQPKTDARTVAAEGFTRVRIMIDVETWLQVGTELYRPDGHLLAAYYFRNPNLKPNLAPDTFTEAGLKK